MATTFSKIPIKIPALSLFRAYDIRGVVDEDLTSEAAYGLGLALGTAAQKAGDRSMVVARDGRLSGPKLQEALSLGIQASGCDVIDLGAVPTPLLYFAAYQDWTGSGVMITGSHNPPNYNGLKMMIAGVTLAGDAILALRNCIEKQEFKQGSGNYQQINIIPDYINFIKKTVSLKRSFKVVVDCGNGIAGMIAPNLLRELGCEVIELFCEVDGHFPNHHPDPSVAENLQDLINTVKNKKADIGLAFDGDGDRLGVVDGDGKIINADRQLMLFAKDLLSRHSNAAIVYDVKCTWHLPRLIQQWGGRPILSKTGHSHIKARLREEKALLAGEMSGHLFFKENAYGFDDGIGAAARLLAILSNDQRTPTAVFNELPDSVNTPELRLAMSDDRKFNFMDKFIENAEFPGGEKITIDGVRVEYDYGWGLLRPSNTTPYLIMRFEANNEENLLKIKELFKRQLLVLDSTLELPF